MVHLPRCLREILVNNLVKRFSCSLLVSIFFISGVASSAQAASETKLCRDTGVAFAFFNGAQTTKPLIGAARHLQEGLALVQRIARAIGHQVLRQHLGQVFPS